MLYQFLSPERIDVLQNCFQKEINIWKSSDS
jgi:hypothetical protein